jgi:hypothetical protein
VVERPEPSFLLAESVLVTGGIPRTTDFEHPMPPNHQALRDGGWTPDRLVLDDQALVGLRSRTSPPRSCCPRIAPDGERNTRWRRGWRTRS